MVDGRPEGQPRRRAGEDPARDDQDQGHHRRSAARRRAVRGAHARRSRRSSPRSTAPCTTARSQRGMRKIIVTGDDGETREYLIPRSIHVNVQEGERVRAGDPLIDGPINPHDILQILGEKELQRYLVDEIQEVYRSQGVNINDKHIEVIVRQMMRCGEDRGGRRHRVPHRRAGRPVPLRRGERARDRRRRRSRPSAGRCCSASPRRRSRPTRSSRRRASRRRRAC